MLSSSLLALRASFGPTLLGVVFHLRYKDSSLSGTPRGVRSSAVWSGNERGDEESEFTVTRACPGARDLVRGLGWETGREVCPSCLRPQFFHRVPVLLQVTYLQEQLHPLKFIQGTVSTTQSRLVTDNGLHDDSLHRLLWCRYRTGYRCHV